MIETEVFTELNVMFTPDGTPTWDLIGDAPPQESENETTCCGLMKSKKTRTRVSEEQREGETIYLKFFEYIAHPR